MSRTARERQHRASEHRPAIPVQRQDELVKRTILTILNVLVLGPARGLLWRSGVLLSSTQVVEGVRVSVLASKEEEAELFEKVRLALSTIRERDPRRYRCLQRDLARIFVADGSGAEYVPTINACHLAISHIRRRSVVELAMTMIHEATHARLWRRGFRYQEHRRERIERLCVSQEVAFAALLPSSEALIEKAEQLLRAQWWTREAQIDESLARLEASNAPAWVLTLGRWMQRTSK